MNNMVCIYALVMFTFMNIKIERLAPSPDLSEQQLYSTVGLNLQCQKEQVKYLYIEIIS